ncbi:O-antigen ligase family protein [Marinobacter salarius]|uniref:O-antigen ligase family protein n=1 Tax=Marinobacter salarius TaxID=1420917 RepID=UPI003D0AF23A
MRRKRKEVNIQDFYALNFGAIWHYFKSETLAFWMICVYLFLEYVRPQSIYPALDFLPWTQIAVLGALAGCFLDKSVRWVSSSINVWLILFFIAILFSSFFAYWPEVSYGQLQNFYTWFIIYFLVINIVNTEKRFFIFLCIFFLASFKLSLSLSITWAKRGFSFTDWGLKGPPGFFENSGELAIQMLVFWPLAWAFAAHLKPYIKSVKYYTIMLMPITAIMVILGASSRGAQLALVVQLIALNYRSIFKPKVIVSCVIIFSVLWVVLPQEQKDRFQVAGDDRTSQQRLLYWENGIKMIQEYPVLGVGYFNYAPYYEVFYPEDMLYEKAQLPHNIFIQVGTDAGLFGLLVYFSLMLVAFRKASKLDHVSVSENHFGHKISTGFNLCLLGFVVAGQFVTVGYYPFFWIHIALLVSMTNILSKRRYP